MDDLRDRIAEALDDVVHDRDSSDFLANAVMAVVDREMEGRDQQVRELDERLMLTEHELQRVRGQNELLRIRAVGADSRNDVLTHRIASDRPTAPREEP